MIIKRHINFIRLGDFVGPWSGICGAKVVCLGGDKWRLVALVKGSVLGSEQHTCAEFSSKDDADKDLQRVLETLS